MTWWAKQRDEQNNKGYNGAPCPDSHQWDCWTDYHLFCQVTATHLKIGYMYYVYPIVKRLDDTQQGWKGIKTVLSTISTTAKQYKTAPSKEWGCPLWSAFTWGWFCSITHHYNICNFIMKQTPYTTISSGAVLLQPEATKKWCLHNNKLTKHACNLH